MLNPKNDDAYGLRKKYKKDIRTYKTAGSTSGICCFFSFVVPNSDVVARRAKGCPGDVEPAGAGQQLVGIRAGAEEIHQALELARVRCVATFMF